MFRPPTTALTRMDPADEHPQLIGLHQHPLAPLFASHRHLLMARLTLTPLRRCAGTANGAPLRAAITVALYAECNEPIEALSCVRYMSMECFGDSDCDGGKQARYTQTKTRNSGRGVTGEVLLREMRVYSTPIYLLCATNACFQATSSLSRAPEGASLIGNRVFKF